MAGKNGSSFLEAPRSRAAEAEASSAAAAVSISLFAGIVIKEGLGEFLSSACAAAWTKHRTDGLSRRFRFPYHPFLAPTAGPTPLSLAARYASLRVVYPVPRLSPSALSAALFLSATTTPSRRFTLTFSFFAAQHAPPSTAITPPSSDSRILAVHLSWLIKHFP